MALLRDPSRGSSDLNNARRAAGAMVGIATHGELLRRAMRLGAFRKVGCRM